MKTENRNIWIEKTLVRGRPNRTTGERALGNALWSPQKDKRGADIYKNMRKVRKNDIILHLIDNEKFSGVSTVKNEAIESVGLHGTDWEGPAYLVKLENYQEFNPPLYRADILNEKNKNDLINISTKSEVFYNNKIELRQGAYLTPCPLELFNLLNTIYAAKNKFDLPYSDLIEEEKITLDTKMAGIKKLEKLNEYALTIKTKPFVILAGLSGTGKSRLVRSLAYKFNNIKEDRDTKKHPPTNFQLIKVKPNWHDSSDLLGYESRISGKDRLIVTDFIRFIVKAHLYPATPFFLCLDEMNLAPVEQYFAEYLSVMETRVLNSTNSKITTDSLISASIFQKYSEKLDGVDEAYELWKELGLTEIDIKQEFLSKGLGLPQNLIVMGTVNMDETTHSFSRKVLDRAMTLEMNKIDLTMGLNTDSNEWDYPESPLSADYVISVKTHGYQVYEEIKDEGDKIITYLESLNEKLENSPFKIAYRVRDEFLLYAYNYSLMEDKPDDWLDDVIDQMTLLKILPRIEGDEDKTNILEDLLIIFNEYNLIDTLTKAKEMEIKRKTYHYTSFWT